MLIPIFACLFSFVGLYWSAEWSVESAQNIGKRLSLPPLVVGGVIIAFGTSLPEFFISHLAMIRGQEGVALGNLVGSNIANSLLVLGLSSLFIPFSFHSSGMRRKLFFHLGIHLLMRWTFFWPPAGIGLLTFFVLSLEDPQKKRT